MELRSLKKNETCELGPTSPLQVVRNVECSRERSDKTVNASNWAATGN